MAEALSISEHTVKSHLKAIFQKTGVASRAQAVARISGDPRFQRVRTPGNAGEPPPGPRADSHTSPRPGARLQRLESSVVFAGFPCRRSVNVHVPTRVWVMASLERVILPTRADRVCHGACTHSESLVRAEESRRRHLHTHSTGAAQERREGTKRMTMSRHRRYVRSPLVLRSPRLLSASSPTRACSRFRVGASGASSPCSQTDVQTGKTESCGHPKCHSRAASRLKLRPAAANPPDGHEVLILGVLVDVVRDEGQRGDDV